MESHVELLFTELLVGEALLCLLKGRETGILDPKLGASLLPDKLVCFLVFIPVIEYDLGVECLKRGMGDPTDPRLAILLETLKDLM